MLSLLKRAYWAAPEPVRSLAGLVPMKVLLGRAYRARLRFLDRFGSLPWESQRQECERRLVRYLNAAITDTPFYQDLARSRGWARIQDAEQLREFPIVRKDQLRADLHWFTPDPPVPGYPVSTGGSTGQPVSLRMADAAYPLEWAYKQHYLQRLGVSLDQRRLAMRGVDFGRVGGPLRWNPLYRELQVSPLRLHAGNLDEVLRAARSFRPVWIHGYPSAVAHFAELCRGRDLGGMAFTIALLVSEPILPHQRRVIREVLGARIASFYGMTERVVFAPLNEAGDFVPDPSYGYTECVDGELVGTGFLNSATRLIRYGTGDAADTETDGSLVRLIRTLEGRWDAEYMIGRNGARVTMTALNLHSAELSGVRRFQFVQSTAGSCELRLVMTSGGPGTDGQVARIRDAFQRKVGSELTITARVVGHIPLTDRGKHRFIVRESS